MSRGQTRITALEPDPVGPGRNYVPSVQSFRSNISDDHFVVSMTEEDRDESPMGYVDKRAAVDLAAHFVGIANDLGANLTLAADLAESAKADWMRGFKVGQQAGHYDGRRSLRDELQAHLNAV